MIKIVQFGEGNFLRTFVEAYFDTLNKEGKDEYEVNIIKPIIFGDLKKFEKQNNKYHIVLRGSKDGKDVEDIYHIDCVKNAISPFENIDAYYSLANDPEVKIIVSNTTEAGICFNSNDKLDNFEGMTYPAKLTLFLLERFKADLDELYVLPVELIENNAGELERCVKEYISLWDLGDSFLKYVNENVFFCNTLVDRVVSGYPRDEEVRNHLYSLIGKTDELISIGEPFGLWTIEDKGNIHKYIKEGTHNIEVILTKNIQYYKKRKVRILNGSHTNLVPICLWHGKENVFDTMVDKKTRAFIDNSLNEIIPYVSSDINATRKYADDVMERFLNPFINHQLTSIALNSISKWKARDLPSFIDYYNDKKEIPHYLTIGFSYLANQYMNIKKIDDKYFVDLPTRRIEVKDDLSNMEYFFTHSLEDFMKDTSLWGIDLTTFKNFAEEVKKNISLIKEGKSLI